jgi:hypothetical protein
MNEESQKELVSRLTPRFVVSAKLARGAQPVNAMMKSEFTTETLSRESGLWRFRLWRGCISRLMMYKMSEAKDAGL